MLIVSVSFMGDGPAGGHAHLPSKSTNKQSIGAKVRVCGTYCKCHKHRKRRSVESGMVRNGLAKSNEGLIREM